MGATLGFRELLRKQLTVQKIFFHIAFWVFHWGIFAYGWCVLDSILSLLPFPPMLNPLQVQAGLR